MLVQVAAISAELTSCTTADPRTHSTQSRYWQLGTAQPELELSFSLLFCVCWWGGWGCALVGGGGCVFGGEGGGVCWLGVGVCVGGEGGGWLGGCVHVKCVCWCVCVG